MNHTVPTASDLAPPNIKCYVSAHRSIIFLLMAIKVYGTSHLITAALSEVESHHTAVNNREMVSVLMELIVNK